MRSANGVLKALGMCCAITMPGASGGMPIRNSLMASVPPVDAPTAISRSVVRNFTGAAFCSTASAERLGAATAACTAARSAFGS